MLKLAEIKTKHEENKKILLEKQQFIKEKTQFKEKFKRLMLELGLYNKFDKTYYLQIESKTNYGFLAKLHLEDGLSFSEFQKNIGHIQESLCCIWIMETIPFKDYANIRIVTQPLDDEIPFEKPKIKPWQMYLGLNLSLDAILNDNNKNQMFLLAGAIGAGKTTLLYMILLSWILGCAVNEVEIYLSDIAKNEFPHFKYVKHIKYYASELEELYMMMQYIRIKIDKRNKIISKYREEGKATNIKEYNAINKSKMSYCYIMIDEFSVVVPDKTDNEDEKNMKQYIIDTLKKISKIGRSLGIFTIICLQKTTKEEMGASILKNMSAVRISFRANDAVSSEVIMGDSSAVGLNNRYAIYSLNGGDKKDYLFSPKLTTERLNDLLKPYIDRNHKKVDIENEIKESNQPPQPPSKVIPLPKKKQKEKTHHYPVIDISKGDDDYVDN